MSADKPAATEHGTGRGEAKPSCITYVGRDDIAQRIIDIVGDRRVPECELKLRVQAYLDTYAKMPTPPTSPTVTLDRETFDKLVAKAESIERAAVHGTFYHAVAIEMLTLLKAAEKEQH